MPVKNAGLYLKTCLDSIVEQTYQNWELIAVEDHSNDDSFDILKKYADLDHRIKCLQNKGQGIIDALRLAYQKCSGDYITRMDADDIMQPNKLELLFEPIHANGKGSLAIGLVKYISTGNLGDGYIAYQNWLNDLSSWRNNFDEIYKECSIPSPAWMLHRDDLDGCGAFDHDIYPEDYDLAFRMREAKLNVYPTPEIVHLWRDHPERSSRTDDNYKDNTFIKLKVHHFLKSDYKEKSELVLWGCGKKGKKIAGCLIDDNIEFKWITNNPNKIGRDIYGVFVQSEATITDLKDSQIIIAIAEKESQKEILKKLNNPELTEKTEYYFFC